MISLIPSHLLVPATAGDEQVTGNESSTIMLWSTRLLSVKQTFYMHAAMEYILVRTVLR